MDINGIKISGSPIEKIKEVIKQSPEYVVCTVKPVTHYANNDSPTPPTTAYTEIDTEFLKSNPFDSESKRDLRKNESHLNYANVEFPPTSKEEESVDYNKEASSNYVNIKDDRGAVQNYAELDFSRR